MSEGQNGRLKEKQNNRMLIHVMIIKLGFGVALSPVQNKQKKS